ncbi:MAG: AbrB/MazE/SpoVT family DNA-binding domain-containing protein [Deltaproteobacteria bacterium]|nr:AbrB/MazE/SpoVT family DNA-binding domain-containing protein [Deltaproteobacteria bacterium]
MKQDGHVTVVTDRGQVSIPAELRRELHLSAGRKLLWEKLSDRELRVRAIDERKPVGPLAVLGFARRFRRERRATADWMEDLRTGER